MPVLKSLQPEVAARYAPARSGHTRFYVMEWSREVDLCQLTLAEADELVKLPNGLDMLQPLKPDTSETIAALVTAPVAKPKRKRKTGAPGGK
ncbi:hypothetical protein [Hymenobacter sp.]|uniref:hypothetical protein n=1 Tax=Hymenobacter sp. TaxID=1898978 RepID=UPI00286A52DE|nr:hypothetical protein [Hymenobacter sp.]